MYWVRRVAVLGTAALMVFAIGRVLAGSSNGADSGTADPGAVQAAAHLTPTAGSSGPKVRHAKGSGRHKKSKSPTSTPTPLAVPSGPCAPEDLVVTPEARNPVGGSDIVIALSFHTQVAAACTFEVSPKTVTMSITSGHDPIWSSRQCPAAVPRTRGSSQP